MVEEHFYWCFVLERWVYLNAEDIGDTFASNSFPSWMPQFGVNIMLGKICKQIKQHTYAQGLGRHSQEEVEQLGQ